MQAAVGAQAPVINGKHKYIPMGESEELEETRLMRECREVGEAAVHRLLGLNRRERDLGEDTIFPKSATNNKGTTALILVSQNG